MFELQRSDLLLVLVLYVLFVSNYIDFCEAKNKHELIDKYDVTDANTLDVENPIRNDNYNNLSKKLNRRKNRKLR